MKSNTVKTSGPAAITTSSKPKDDKSYVYTAGNPNAAFQDEDKPTNAVVEQNSREMWRDWLFFLNLALLLLHMAWSAVTLDWISSYHLVRQIAIGCLILAGVGAFGSAFENFPFRFRSERDRKRLWMGFLGFAMAFAIFYVFGN